MNDLHKLAREQERADAAYKAAQEKKRAIKQALERTEQEAERVMRDEIAKILLRHGGLEVTGFDYGRFESWATANSQLLKTFATEPGPLVDQYDRLMTYKRNRAELARAQKEAKAKKKKGE